MFIKLNEDKAADKSRAETAQVLVSHCTELQTEEGLSHRALFSGSKALKGPMQQQSAKQRFGARSPGKRRHLHAKSDLVRMIDLATLPLKGPGSHSDKCSLLVCSRVINIRAE